MPEAGQADLASLLRRLFGHLSPRRRRQFALLLVLMLASALAEVVSLGAVLPFLGLLTAPDQAFNHPVVARIAQAWGIDSGSELVLPMTIAFALAALAAASIRILFLWFSTRIAFGAGADLSIKVYRLTLYQPYPVHLARNSSTVISGIVNKINGATAVLVTLLTFLSSVVLLTAVMAALIVIDPLVASLTAAAFGASYALIALNARRKLQRNSERIAHEQTQVVKALQEGLGGIRDVLLDGTQEAYCEIYRKADVPLRRAHGNNTFLGQSPRFAMEAVGMVLIAAIAYSLSRQQGGLATAIPVLGALALGAQRLLPALQQAYSAWAGLAGSEASLVDALELLDQPEPAGGATPPPEPIQVRHAIALDAVRFRYTDGGPWVLDDLTLAIPRGVRIGIIGRSGTGKSTLIDVLMGLLLPTEGRVLVDGVAIDGKNLRAWQGAIAHVPQSIYLADAPLVENIAFGIPRHSIDLDRVREAARQAQIADAIEAMAHGYETLVGERGVRLSGGQRQRVGIARALYKQASVLVLDEATSALDTETEDVVMGAIEGLDRELTILIIAHRVSTLRSCGTIFQLANGRVEAQGTYDQLVERGLVPFDLPA